MDGGMHSWVLEVRRAGLVPNGASVDMTIDQLYRVFKKRLADEQRAAVDDHAPFHTSEERNQAAADLGRRCTGKNCLALLGEPHSQECVDEHSAAAALEEVKAVESPERAALQEIHSWLVCWPIATPQDMAHSFESMERVAARGLGVA